MQGGNMNKPSSALVISLLLLSITPVPGFTAAPSFQSAIADYNAGKYTVALNEFKQFEARYPTNAMSHYYLALCYQSVGDRTNARNEFNMTNQYGDATLKGYAQKALAFLGGSGSSGGSGGSSGSAGSGGSGSSSGGAPAIAISMHDLTSGAISSGKTSKVSEVLEFYTDWCHVCKQFAPVWTEAQEKISGVSFHSYNAEDQSNESLVKKYRVLHYPTLVYLDRSGKELKNYAGTYFTANDFANSIREVH
jgi:thiol-disulfide isomerase/thioredoxin